MTSSVFLSVEVIAHVPNQKAHWLLPWFYYASYSQLQTEQTA